MLLAGCVSGTTLPQAGGDIESDTRAVLSDGSRRLGTGGAAPAFSSDTTQPCGEGKARRVLRGQVPLRPAADPRVTLDQATDVSIGMISSRGYRLDAPPLRQPGRRREFVMVQDSPGGRIVVRLQGGRRRSTMDIEAATACLPRG